MVVTCTMILVLDGRLSTCPGMVDLLGNLILLTSDGRNDLSWCQIVFDPSRTQDKRGQ